MVGNPYVSQLRNIAGQGAMQLRSAAMQQQQAQERLRKQGLAEQLDMARLVNEGWQVYEPSRNVTTESSGLKRRDQSPAPPNMVELPTIGKRLYRPNETGKERQQREQAGFSDLRTALNEGAQPVDANGNIVIDHDIPRLNDDITGMTSGLRVPVPDQARVMNVPGGGRVYMPSSEEKSARGLKDHLTQAAATNDAQGWTPPQSLVDSLEERAGLPAGSLKGVRLPHQAVADAFKRATTPEKETPDKFLYNHSTDDAGNVNITRIGADGTPTKWDGKAWVPLAAGNQAGKATRDSEATARADRFREREEDKKQKTVDDAQKRIDALQTQEQKVHGLRQALGDAMAAKNDERFVDPITGREMVMNEGRRQFYRDRLGAATKQVEALQDQQKKLVQRHGGGSTGDGAAPAQQKIAGLEKVREYAQRKGISEADAVKEFQAAGWSIGR